MAFKKLLSLECEATTALGGQDRKTGKKNPTTVEGYFLGSRDVESPRGKNKLHVFQTRNGNIGVWGKTHLNQQLGSVKPGTMSRVSFTGMMQTKNGEMYRYGVEVDDSEIIEVNLATPEQTTETHAEPTISDEEYAAATSEESDEIEEAVSYVRSKPTPPKAARTVDAEKQARVQALLSGRK